MKCRIFAGGRERKCFSVTLYGIITLLCEVYTLGHIVILCFYTIVLENSSIQNLRILNTVSRF